MTSEPTARGVSLWLMPEGKAREHLAELIGGLAARLGTTPFAPHVTLLPGLGGPEDQVVDRARSLAASLSVFTVAFSEVAGLDRYFQCLFLRAQRDSPLEGAHGRAARVFERDPNPAFDPHLSLVYGDLDIDTKVPLARELSGEIGSSFEARRVHAWRTQGPVGEWRPLASFDLGEKSGDTQ